MNIKFYAPTKLFFGISVINDHKGEILPLGTKCLIVTSATAALKSGALDDVKRTLDSSSIDYIIHDSVSQNPLLEDAYNAGKKAFEFNADFIVGIGGGSPIDAAKAAAIYAANPSLDLMGIYDLAWHNKPLPLVAVGTSAGTGSEVNKFSVLTKPDGRKQSIAHNDCYPYIAFSDPKYTYSLPKEFTISTALDALSHSLEAYYSTEANKISDLFAIESIKIILDTLDKIKTSSNITEEDRENLLYSSICAGYALDICGTVYCHALGYFLSEEYHIPHGIACAAYLPAFLDREKHLMPKRAEKLEQEIGIDHTTLGYFIAGQMPPVDIGLTEEQIQNIVDSKTDSANFKRTAPNGLSKEEGYEIMRDLFLQK